MSDELKDKQRRAQEIAEMIKRGDEQKLGNLDKLLKALDGLLDGMGSPRQRMDALESGHLKMHGGTHRGERVVPTDDEPQGGPGRSPISDDHGKALERGEPKGVVADSLFGHGDRGEFFSAQDRADMAFRSWGLAGSPAPMQGEALKDYRLRLLGPHQKHSKQFGKADLNVGEPLFSELEKTILADSVAAAYDNSNMPDMTLREIRKLDQSGRQVTNLSASRVPGCPRSPGIAEGSSDSTTPPRIDRAP
jgi:hypothetical protein